MGSRLRQIPESLLARLWQERASREASLRSGDGQRLRVIYPGRAGRSAGPDFRDAVLEEEGVGLVREDVEIHVKQRDWDSHGHGKDPRYNGVVLHVVARMDAPSTTLHSGRQIPVLSLEPLLSGRPSKREGPELWDLLRTHGYARPQTTAEMGALLDGAGDARFLGNSDAFLALMREDDAEQVLYGALMEALGYSQNTDAFLELAHRVPCRLLRELALETPDGHRVETFQQLLLTAAGFQSPASPLSTGAVHPIRGRRDGRHGNRAKDTASGVPGCDHPPAALIPGRRGHISPISPPIGTGAKGRVKAMNGARWHLFRVRPQNQPRRRNAGFAHLLNLFLPLAEAGYPSWGRLGLVEGMSHLLANSSSPSREGRCRRGLVTGLMARCDECANTGSLIGEARARDMAVNCVLPFLHALAQPEPDSQLARTSIQAYRCMPALQENELTREMRRCLLAEIPNKGGNNPRQRNEDVERDPEKLVLTARRQQGLLHLHQLIASPAKGVSGAVTQYTGEFR